MNDLQVGAVVRAVRRRRGLRQQDVAGLSKSSQQLVSMIELGRLEEVGLRASRRVLAVMGIQLLLEPRYRGADAHRLLDAAHAAIVETVVRRLTGCGWQTEPEYTFNYFGERGSVDVLATRPDRKAAGIIEVKSRIIDVQGTLAPLDRQSARRADRAAQGTQLAHRPGRPHPGPARYHRQSHPAASV